MLEFRWPLGTRLGHPRGPGDSLVPEFTGPLVTSQGHAQGLTKSKHGSIEKKPFLKERANFTQLILQLNGNACFSAIQGDTAVDFVDQRREGHGINRHGSPEKP
jgi:hypothetical protein